MSTYLNLYLQKDTEKPRLFTDFGGSSSFTHDLIDAFGAKYGERYNSETGKIESFDAKKSVNASDLDEVIAEKKDFIKRTEKRIAMYREFLSREDRDEYFRLKKQGIKMNEPEETEDSLFDAYVSEVESAGELINEIISDEEYVAELYEELGELNMLQRILYSIEDKSWTDFDKVLVDLT